VDLRKPEIELKLELHLLKSKQFWIQIQFTPQPGFTLIRVRIAKIRTPRLARFMLYNSPA